MTVIDVPARPEDEAVFIKAHLKLMAAGMTNSRFTKTQMIAKASAITGKTYGRGKIDLAIADLQSIVDGAARKTEYGSTA